jgi:integrase
MHEASSHGRRLTKTGTPGIFRRGRGFVVVYRDPHGRQRKRAARTMAEARNLKAVVRADVARGEYRTLSRITFWEYAPEWIALYKGRTTRGFRESTRKEYARDLGLDPVTFSALDPVCDAMAFFGKMRLPQIEPRDVKRYQASLENRGLAPASIARRIAPLRALFATAVEEGLIRSNPASGIRLTTSHVETDAPEKVKALTEDELGRLLEALPERWRPLIAFMAHTGLRISEVVALRWSDIDFGNRRVEIRRAYRDGVFAPPKSRYARRDVPLSQGMAQRLWELKKSAGGGADAPIFTAARGGLLDPGNTAARVLKPAARAAGVPWAAFHTLRHSCATMLFRHGANAKQVQVWLGHHSPAFTLATYVHLLPDDLPDPSFFDNVTAGMATSEHGVNQALLASVSN